MRPALRLVQYNVCGFKQGYGESVNSATSRTVAAIASSLKRLKPDLVALNEVNRKGDKQCLEKIANELGIQHIAFFGHAYHGDYGNALLSRYPIVSKHAHHLNGGTKIVLKNTSGRDDREPKTKRIIRGLLVCNVQLGTEATSPCIQVGVTHLDHMNPEERQIQLQHAMDILAENNISADEVSKGEKLTFKAKATVLVGDLNALNREDYTAEEWEAKQERYKDMEWNGPFDCARVGRVLHTLQENGFYDCFDVTSRSPDSSSLPATRLRTTPVENPTMRIDYVFANDPLLRLYQPKNPQVVEWLTESDHFPVCVDLVPKESKL